MVFRLLFLDALVPRLQGSVARQVSAFLRAGFSACGLARLQFIRSIQGDSLNGRMRKEFFSPPESESQRSRKNQIRLSAQNSDAVKIQVCTFRNRGAGFHSEEKYAMKAIGARPNQSPEPTTLLVTIRACARLAPSRVVAHL
jgi:hypothetical protein